MKLKLRPYQLDALEALKKDFFEENYQRLLLVIPTGGGKTIVFNSFALENSLKTLVIAHREELLQQAIEKYLLIGGKEEDTGLIKKGNWEEKPYTAGSIQTLVRNLERLNGKKWDLVVVDEAHHTMADTYQAVLNRLLETNPDLKILGVTATPFRSDDRKLKDFYQKISYAVDIVDLIKWGYLVPFAGKRIYLEEIDLDKVSLTKEGDFSLKSLSALYNNEKVIERIIDEWIEKTGAEKKTIFFTPSIEVSLKVRDALWRRGIPAEHIDGKLSSERRKEIISMFREGKLIALTNVNVLTEGFDDPAVEVIANLRPTKSKVLYTQIIGRALRPFFGKKKAYILDFTGVSKQHSVAGLHLLFNLPPSLEREYLEGKELEIGKVGDGEVGVKVDGKLFEIGKKEEEKEEKKKPTKEVIKTGEEEFSYEGQELQNYITKLENKYILTCGFNKKLVVLEQKQDGLFEVYISLPYGAKEVLYEKVPYDYAFAVAETIFNECKDKKADKAIQKMAQLPPTEKQMRLINSKIAKHYKIDKVESRLDGSNIIGLAINEKLSTDLSVEYRYLHLFIAYLIERNVFIFAPSLVTEGLFEYLVKNNQKARLTFTGLNYAPYLVEVDVKQEEEEEFYEMLKEFGIANAKVSLEVEYPPEPEFSATVFIPSIALAPVVDFNLLKKNLPFVKHKISDIFGYWGRFGWLEQKEFLPDLFDDDFSIFVDVGSKTKASWEILSVEKDF